MSKRLQAAIVAAISLASCNDKAQADLDKLDGEWTIKSITSTHADGSVARQETQHLGYLSFQRCNYRKEERCAASRRPDSGDAIALQVLPASDKEQARIDLTFITPNRADDWTGTYDIFRDGKQMTFVCDQCPASAGGTFTIVTEKK